MASTTRILVVLRLPKPVPDLLVRARHIVEKMTGSTYFPTPNPSLSAVTADIDALAGAETNARSRTSGLIEVRNLKRTAVISDLEALQSYVQTVVDQNPAQAGAIIEAAGMARRVHRTPIRREIEAALGATPGTVVVRARARGRHAAYEWQISADGGQTWTTLALTTVARTTARDLRAGTTYLFRVRTTVGSTTTDWSQAASILVH